MSQSKAKVIIIIIIIIIMVRQLVCKPERSISIAPRHPAPWASSFYRVPPKRLQGCKVRSRLLDAVHRGRRLEKAVELFRNAFGGAFRSCGVLVCASVQKRRQNLRVPETCSGHQRCPTSATSRLSPGEDGQGPAQSSILPESPSTSAKPPISTC